MKMKFVCIKLDPKKKCRNAFYFLSIKRIIMENLEVDNYFDMQIRNGEIEIASDNEKVIDGLNGLLNEVEDEND